MVKLSPDLIQQCIQHFNAVKERELVLRGFKIPVIENLGATLDQFDTFDLSDNDIRKLDGFPHLKRLNSILANNNRIVRIGEDISESLPNLKTLVLTNNSLQELKDLDPLFSCKRLEYLSLINNPVTSKAHYRLYIIHKAPQIRVIDYNRVKLREREEARKLFKSSAGKEIQKQIKKTSTFVPGEDIRTSTRQQLNNMSEEDQKSIREAIANATSMEEVEKLQHMLRSGTIPNKKRKLNEEEETD